MFGIRERRELEGIVESYLLFVDQKTEGFCPTLITLAPSLFETDKHKANLIPHMKAAIAVCLILATKLSYSHSKYVNHLMGLLANSVPEIFAICTKDYLTYVLMHFSLNSKNENLSFVFDTVTCQFVVKSSEKDAGKIDKDAFVKIFKPIEAFLDDETVRLTQPYLKFKSTAVVPNK